MFPGGRLHRQCGQQFAPPWNQARCRWPPTATRENQDGSFRQLLADLLASADVPCAPPARHTRALRHAGRDRSRRVPQRGNGQPDRRCSRLVRHREQFRVGGAAADKHAFESANFDQTSRQEIVGVGADQRLRSIHQFAKTCAHCSRCRARLSGGQRTGSRHQSRCRQSSDLDKLTSIGFSGHDRSLKL